MTRFRSTFGTLGFDEKSFFNTLLGFIPYWDYKPTNAIHSNSPGVYTSGQNLYSIIIGKINLKCDVIDGSIEDSLDSLYLSVLFQMKQQVLKYFLNLKHCTFKKRIIF